MTSATTEAQKPSETPHKAGFVSIIGKPNAGKSTLMNRLVGERISIITSKAQTTRHRIFGIVSGTDFQIVYSDTPGVIQPRYELQKSMMRFVHASLEDADCIVLVTDIFEEYDETDVLTKIAHSELPIILLINKIDKAKENVVETKIAYWKDKLPEAIILPISALEGTNVEQVFDLLLQHMPVHPAYFDKEELTDKSERFFASEIVREKIMELYKQEVPYSSEVVVTEFKERDDMIVIHAEIYVERQTQRAIIIGDGGAAIKKLGIKSRETLVQFFGKKVFLETHVKVEPDWRSKPHKLKYFGYGGN